MSVPDASDQPPTHHTVQESRSHQNWNSVRASSCVPQLDEALTWVLQNLITEAKKVYIYEVRVYILCIAWVRLAMVIFGAVTIKIKINSGPIRCI